MRWFLSLFLSLCARSCMMVRWQRWRVINENRRRKKNRTIIINVCSTEWMKRVLNAFLRVSVVFSSFRVEVVWPGKKNHSTYEITFCEIFLLCKVSSCNQPHIHTQQTAHKLAMYYTYIIWRSNVVDKILLFLFGFRFVVTLLHFDGNGCGRRCLAVFLFVSFPRRVYLINAINPQRKTDAGTRPISEILSISHPMAQGTHTHTRNTHLTRETKSPSMSIFIENK